MIVRVARTLRPLRPGRLAFAPPRRRYFSVKAIYSTFPATLHYYSPRPGSRLYDHREYNSDPDNLHDEGVIVDEDGRVYPHATGSGRESLSLHLDVND